MRCRTATAAAALVLSVLAPGLLAGSAAASPDPLSGQALFRDVVHYVRLGPHDHLTGSRSDLRTQDWMRRELAAAGLRTGVDGYSYFGFSVRHLALTVANRRYRSIAALYYSGATGPSPRLAELAYAGLGTSAEVSQADVGGRIAVIQVPYVADGGLDPTLSSAFSNIEQAGAVGLIAVTDGPQDFPVNQDVDSRAGVQELPTLLVGKRSGQAIIAAAKAHRHGSLLLDAAAGRRCTTNSWGVLPGLDAHRYVIVGTPTGAWTPSASERGPGVAILLGLARHYASLPLSDRPVTLVFAVLSGHEIGYLGLPTLIATHPDWFSHADDYVHLGASLAALQQVEEPDGAVVKLASGDWTRTLYVSENPLLQPGVQAAFTGAGPMPSSPPGVFDPGEQGYAYHDGIPIIAESGASYYFHTAGDEPAGVGAVLLSQQARAFEAAIDYVAGLPAGALRAANAAAARLGARSDPNPTPTGGATEQPAYAPEPDAACVSTAQAASRSIALSRGSGRPPS